MSQTLADALFALASESPYLELHPEETERVKRVVRLMLKRMTSLTFIANLPLPPIESIKDRIFYDPETGVFTKLLKSGVVKPCGAHVSTAGYNRFEIWVDGKRYRCQAHRLAWLMYHGVPPEEGMVVHHIDGNKLNNRIVNLAVVRHSTNCILGSRWLAKAA